MISRKTRHGLLRWKIALFIAILTIIVILGFWIANKNSATFTAQKAQEVLDTAIENIYQEAEGDNFLLKCLKDRNKVTVNNIVNKDNSLYADCTVTTIDAASAIIDFMTTCEMENELSYNEIIYIIETKINESTVIEKNFLVEFRDEEGKYKAILQEEFILFYFGNMQEMIPVLNEILLEG